MRTYTQEEKQAVIGRVISGEPSASILADTGIPKSTFYGWVRAYRNELEAGKRNIVVQLSRQKSKLFIMN